MYDELVKELREAEKEAKELFTNPYRFIPYYGKAADAIEELSRGVSVWAKRAMAWAAEAEKAEKAHRWIPVTEGLPEDGSLVGKLIADSDGNIRIASQCAEITLSGGKTVYTDLIDLVSLLAEDTPTTKWEDCTNITHWMPLPEPPKEEL